MNRPHSVDLFSVTSLGLSVAPSAPAGHLLHQHQRTNAFPLRGLPPLWARKSSSRERRHGSGTVRVQTDRRAQAGFSVLWQASQYARMGAELYRHQPIFRKEINRCADTPSRRGRPLRDAPPQRRRGCSDRRNGLHAASAVRRAGRPPPCVALAISPSYWDIVSASLRPLIAEARTRWISVGCSVRRGRNHGRSLPWTSS